MAENFEYTRSWLNAEDFPLLGFTKNWENPADYPTIETDEAQVRRDMQSLHDEVKDYLNDTLIPRVIAEDATVAAWQAQEDAHAEAEASRVLAEEARVEAENLRVEAEADREKEIAKVENLSVSSEAKEYGESASVEVTENPETGGLNLHFGLPMGKNGLDFLPVIEGDNPPAGVEAWIDPSVEAFGNTTYTKEVIDEKLAAKANKDTVVRPNLLDNAYFGNPVDQRGGYVVPPGASYRQIEQPQDIVGVTTQYYTATLDEYNNAHIIVDGVERWVYAGDEIHAVRGYTGTGYTIDRWNVTDGQNKLAVLVNDDSVTLDYSTTNESQSWFTQYSDLKFPVGTELTLSLLVRGLTGTAYLMFGSTSNYIALSEGMNAVRFVATTDAVFSRIVLAGGAVVEIRAAKLELGDTQTLAHQDANGNWVLKEIPNKAEEEFKCIHSTADPSDTYANKEISSGGLEMELLWENATLTSEFSSQMVIPNKYADYRFFDIYFAIASDSGNEKCKRHEFVEKVVGGQSVLDYNWSNAYAHRLITFNEEGITFHGGYSNGANRNNCVIPYRIYGIKGVKENV